MRTVIHVLAVVILIVGGMTLASALYSMMANHQWDYSGARLLVVGAVLVVGGLGLFLITRRRSELAYLHDPERMKYEPALPFNFACPDCSKSYHGTPAMRGTVFKCRKCGNEFQVEPAAVSHDPSRHTQ